MNDIEKDYKKLYTELKCIGKGNFGVVYLVRNNQDKLQYVAKKIALDALSEREVESAFGEVFTRLAPYRQHC